jgi:uncharacterized protein (DUF2147 family)
MLPRALCGAALAMLAVGWSSVGMGQSRQIIGVWWTDKNEARVEIKACAPPQGGLCGTIIWLSQPNDERGRPLVDKENADPKLKRRPVLGLQLFAGWQETGAGRWKGAIYDPDSGKTYDVDVAFGNDKLAIKGCILLFCDSSTWTRYVGQ